MGLVTVNRENIAFVSDEVMGYLKQFSDVFKVELGDVEGELHLVLDKTVVPVKLPCRKWPEAITKVKAELERLQALGVITTVNTPTDWVSSVEVTMKPNGSV